MGRSWHVLQVKASLQPPDQRSKVNEGPCLTVFVDPARPAGLDFAVSSHDALTTAYTVASVLSCHAAIPAGSTSKCCQHAWTRAFQVPQIIVQACNAHARGDGLIADLAIRPKVKFNSCKALIDLNVNVVKATAIIASSRVLK